MSAYSHHGLPMFALLFAAQFALPTTGYTQSPTQTTGEKKAETPKASEGDDKAATTITVQGKKRVDLTGKEVYDLSKDSAAATGTAAEALNKMPGVSVDAQGDVSVRGQTARVYLNGRPSLMLSGDNRAVALRAMPSAYISSIEVISNPGAQYSSSGSGPIVNIVTKRNLPPGLFGSVSAQVASRGGGNTNAYLSYTQGKLNIDGFAAVFDGRFDSDFDSASTAFDASGGAIRKARSEGTVTGRYRIGSLTTNLQYDLSDNDVLTGGLSYNKGKVNSDFAGYTASRGADGALSDIFRSQSDGRTPNDNGSLSFGYTHYGQKPDQSFKLDLTVSQSNRDTPSLTRLDYERASVSTNTGRRYTRRDGGSNTRTAMLSVAYNTTIDRVQVSVGSQFDTETSKTETLSLGPAGSVADLQLDALLSNRFSYVQQSAAVYATAQWELTPKWTLLGGLRAETLELSTEVPGTTLENQIAYARFNPSLFATYAFSAKRRLRLSYTHKQQRPQPVDLNPGLVFSSATAVTIGNAALGPEEVDSLEIIYEVNRPHSDYRITGFYRFKDETIVTSSRVIADPQNLGNFVTETTRTNAGWERNYGLTATYSQRWNNTLNVNVDMTVTSVDIDVPELSIRRSDTALSGGVSLNYTLKKGSLSLNYKLNVRSYTTQGYRGANGSGMIDYRRNLKPKLSLVITVQEPLPLTKIETVTETNRFRSVSVSENRTPTIMIGLSRQLGGFSSVPKKR